MRTKEIWVRCFGIALVLAGTLLLGGCLADHHHHPTGPDSTDAAFDRYFAEKESAPPPQPGQPAQPQPGTR
ncbi:MAG: hypothetical protein HY720_31000 [Planctomycetes bacterium]|nr:hypothetical protein [Planctomycetota bacterium]